MPVKYLMYIKHHTKKEQHHNTLRHSQRVKENLRKTRDIARFLKKRKTIEQNYIKKIKSVDMKFDIPALKKKKTWNLELRLIMAKTFKK